MFERAVGIVDALRRRAGRRRTSTVVSISCRVLADDAQRDLAVLQIEALADGDVGGQIAIGRADAFVRSFAPARDVMTKRSPRSSRTDRAPSASGPVRTFGPGRSCNSAVWMSELVRRCARALAITSAVLLRRSVREVQAQHVGARDEERTQDCRVARSRADRRDDLRAFLQNRFHRRALRCATATGRLLRSIKRT